MAGAQPPPAHEVIGEDFLEQLLSIPTYSGTGEGFEPTDDMGLHLSTSEGPSAAGGGREFASNAAAFPLKLGLEQARTGFPIAPEAAASDKRLRDDAEGKAPTKLERDTVQLVSFFPAFGHVQPHQIRPIPPPQVFHSQVAQSPVATTPQPSAPRPRVRARRGQATDPHSIAERLRRERIAERMRELQDLLPNSNKTDRAAMLDEILDYVKFLRLQVKVLSMSRLGGAGAVAQLVADIPLSSIEGDTSEGGNKQQIWEKWSNDGTERQVAKLMEENIGSAMQFLQSKALCIMPISLATAIYSHHPPDAPSTVKPEPNTPS